MRENRKGLADSIIPQRQKQKPFCARRLFGKTVLCAWTRQQGFQTGRDFCKILEDKRIDFKVVNLGLDSYFV